MIFFSSTSTVLLTIDSRVLRAASAIAPGYFRQNPCSFSAATRLLPPPAEPVSSTTGDVSRHGATCHGSGSYRPMTLTAGWLVPVIGGDDGVALHDLPAAGHVDRLLRLAVRVV